MNRRIRSTSKRPSSLLGPFLGLALNFGCSGNVELNLLSDNARTAIVAVQSLERLELQAFDLDQTPLQLSFDDTGDLEFYVLLYTQPLAQLLLTPGTLELAIADQPGVALPTPEQVFKSTVFGTRSSSWMQTSLEGALAGVRLKTLKLTECLERGACLDERAPDGELICNLNCEMPPEPTPPTEPMLPRFNCPPGWRSVQTRDVMHCAPWPSAGRLDCPEGAVHHPGEPGCTQLVDCPIGPWPDALPSAPEMLFIDPSAPAGGSGSQGSPLRDLASAMMLASPSALLVLSQGVHPTTPINMDVTIVGLCPAQTQLGTNAGTPLQITNARVELQNLKLVAGVNVTQTGALSLQQVIAEGPIDLRNSTLSAEAVALRGPLAGLLVTNSEATFERAALYDLNDIAQMDNATLTLRDSALFASRQLHALNTSTVTIERCAVDGVRLGSRLGGHFNLIDSVVKDAPAHGFNCEDGSVRLSSTWIESARTTGLLIAGGSARVTDLLVTDTRPEGQEFFGKGIRIVSGKGVEIERALISRAHSIGVDITDHILEAQLTDLTIVETLPTQLEGKLGRGMEIVDSNVSLIRAKITQSRVTGAFVSGPRTMLQVEDLEISQTATELAFGGFGRGLEVSVGANVVAERVRITGNNSLALFVLADSYAKFSDLEVSETEVSEECDEAGCENREAVGIAAHRNAIVEVDRFLLRNNAETGVRITDRSSALLQNGLISGHQLGALVGVAGYDPKTMAVRVRYEDNLEAMRILDE